MRPRLPAGPDPTEAPAARDSAALRGYSPQDRVCATHVLRGLGTGPANATAALLLNHVIDHDSVAVGDLVELLRKRYSVSTAEAEAGVAGLVAQAQDAALLSVDTSFRGQMRHGIQTARELPLAAWGGSAALSQGARRRITAPTLGHLLDHSLAAHTWRCGLLTLGWTVLGLLWGMVDLTVSGLAAPALFFALSLLVLTVVGAVHEGAHLELARRFCASRVALFSSGLRFGVQRSVLPPWRDALVSIAGPVAGLIALAFLWLGSEQLFAGPLLGSSPLLEATTRAVLVVGLIMNVAALVPPSPDARAIWRAVVVGVGGGVGVDVGSGVDDGAVRGQQTGSPS